MDDDRPQAEPLESREPSLEDLVALCSNLNARGAHYMVIGGFAMRAAGYDRRTMDVDLLIEATPENEASVIAAVSELPDHAARELRPGEIAEFVVVRVADEIVVDLMQSASGFNYEAASGEILWRQVSGVQIPFASPALLLRMKRGSVRAKDLADVQFLEQLEASG
ncbi:MAG: nucleotidyltransferase [Polyangiaceae bacterium]|nr:nucleotidyltransferase [Polyangiaceae bacterium]